MLSNILGTDFTPPISGTCSECESAHPLEIDCYAHRAELQTQSKSIDVSLAQRMNAY